MLLIDHVGEISDQPATVRQSCQDVAAGLVAQVVCIRGKHGGALLSDHTTFDAP